MILNLKKKIINNFTSIKITNIKKKELTYNFQKNIIEIEFNNFINIFSKNSKISNRLKKILENSNSMINKSKEFTKVNKKKS